MIYTIVDPTSGNRDFAVDKPNARAAAEYWLLCQGTWRMGGTGGVLLVVDSNGKEHGFPLTRMA